MSKLVTDTLENVAATKSRDVADLIDGVCTAWVRFDGTGTVAIRDSFNVSSITDNGVGDYTVNFATAMLNALYSASGNAASARGGITINTSTTTGQDIKIRNSVGDLADFPVICVVFHGGR